MAATPKTLYRGRPSNGAVATLYTATNTAGYWTIVKNIWLANTTASAATITLYTVATGGSPSDDNVLMKALEVSGSQVISLDMSIPLGPNETLRAIQGTSNAICVTVGGVEYTPPS